MEICIIVAKAKNNVIGKDNQLIWHLPTDLAHFKRLTISHPIIMGRKTFESIGRPLPKRRNIIITRNAHYKQDKCLVFNNLEDAIVAEKNKNTARIFIIGGAEIYRLAIPLATHLFVTEVHHDFEGDAFFPPLNMEEWKEYSRSHHNTDEKHTYAFDFVEYRRKV